MSQLNELATVSKISSQRLSIPGPHGMLIAGYLDESSEEEWNQRVVILAPRYGETKKNNLQFAYFLAANGFKVLRFDQSNHIGESDGTMDQFTLANAAEDIRSVVDYVDREFDASKVILLTLSLSSRCGLRACADDPRISLFISVVGMVDMDATLQSIYKRDFFGELSSGADWRMVDILGFEIDGAHFHDSLVDSRMKRLDGTIEDAAKIQAPVLHLYAEKDLWVRKEDVEAVIGACKFGQMVCIPDVGHEINENPDAVRFVFQKVIEFCCQDMISPPEVIRQADKRVLLEQNKLERNRLKEILKFSENENDFWGRYLGKFGIIEEAHYYVEYFRRMAELLGALRPNDIILDAGCGNGFYGINVIRSLLAAAPLEATVPPGVHYGAIDLTTEGLSRAYSRHVMEIIEIERSEAAKAFNGSYSYRKIDFDTIDPDQAQKLPFADNSVNKICCSLVLSYLKDPLCLMKEFYRILHPDGVAVVSSMKPGCDMTVLYHDFVTVDTPDDDSGRDANQLLSAAGQIKIKQDTGDYVFFSRKELAEFADKAGFKDIREFRSFGNQANVVRIVK